MTLPPIRSDHETPRIQRPVVFAAVVGGGLCLLVAITGLVLIALFEHAAQDAITALSTIGGTLAGAFGGWIARDYQRNEGLAAPAHRDMGGGGQSDT